MPKLGSVLAVFVPSSLVVWLHGLVAVCSCACLSLHVSSVGLVQLLEPSLALLHQGLAIPCIVANVGVVL